MALSEKQTIEGPLLIRPIRYVDERGFFSETYSQMRYRKLGLPDFVQDNHSLSLKRGTVRGLHLQREPWAQAKLVSVLRGEIFDVVVDLRPNSKTFGEHLTFLLTAKEGEQLFVPIGFAHGFMTLCDDTEVIYKVSALYNKESEAGIHFNDPDLSIQWPALEPSLSEKDQKLPPFKEYCHA